MIANPEINRAIESAARKHGLEPAMLHAVAKSESNYNPAAVSSAGALGLFQFMPATASGLGIDPLNVHEAAEGAARFLLSLFRRYDNWRLALAAYNWGPRNVDKHRDFSSWPAETQKYVTKVMERWQEYRGSPFSPPPRDPGVNHG